MPEGPEIHRVADRLRQVLKRKTIQSAHLAYHRLQGHDACFLGHRVMDVTARGKALLIRLSSGHTLYSHNQLYGRWTIDSVKDPETVNRSLRLALETRRHLARLWSATDIEIMRTEDENNHPFLARLGPDVLDDQTTPELIYERLRSSALRNKKAANLMLDQSAFAGIGNYLRSEILFDSRVHPDLSPGDLSNRQLKDWAHSIKSLSDRAYQTGGLTIDAQTAEKAIPSEPLRRHWVFNRNGKSCPRCRSTIERKRYGGRRLDYCPTCQTRP